MVQYLPQFNVSIDDFKMFLCDIMKDEKFDLLLKPGFYTDYQDSLLLDETVGEKHRADIHQECKMRCIAYVLCNIS